MQSTTNQIQSALAQLAAGQQQVAEAITTLAQASTTAEPTTREQELKAENELLKIENTRLKALLAEIGGMAQRGVVDGNRGGGVVGIEIETNEGVISDRGESIATQVSPLSNGAEVVLPDVAVPIQGDNGGNGKGRSSVATLSSVSEFILLDSNFKPKSIAENLLATIRAKSGVYDESMKFDKHLRNAYLHWYGSKPNELTIEHVKQLKRAIDLL